MEDINTETQKRFKTVYLSRTYTMLEIADKLGIARTSVYKLKRKYFPSHKNSDWRQRMFVKLYDTGAFTLEEITGLLNTTRTSVLRFKRKYKKVKPQKDKPK